MSEKMEVPTQKQVKVNKRNGPNTPEELEKLSQKVNSKNHNQETIKNQSSIFFQELIEKIIRLNSHNQQLKNILEKKINPEGSSKSYKPGRNYDYSKSFKRHILLKFCYMGWDMDGYVVQEGTIDTVGK